MKLGLGTVQFGLDYGISNPGGRVPVDQISQVLEAAGRAGVDLLDTAPRYGESERVLGRFLPQLAGMKIVTKTPQFNTARLSESDAERLEASLEESLASLRVPCVYGLLIHQAEDLLAEGGAALFDAMLRLKASQRVEKIGVSVYSGEQIERIGERFAVDLIQLPLNVLDQRLLAGGYLAALKAKGVEIHVRSVFLQGLLLMDPGRLPPWFDMLKPGLARYRTWLAAHRLSPVQGALAFLRRIGELDYAILGVTSASEMAELLSAWDCVLPDDLDFSPFACADEKLVNPALWPAAAHRPATISAPGA